MASVILKEEKICYKNVWARDLKFGMKVAKIIVQSAYFYVLWKFDQNLVNNDQLSKRYY